MAGNLREYVNDWYFADYYQGAPSNNPTGPASGTYRVVRGGSYDSDEDDIRTFARDSGWNPVIQHYNTGFRCASDVTPTR